MRPGLVDEDLLDVLFLSAETAIREGNPIRFVRDRDADRNLKNQIMPDSSVDKSIVSRHYKQLCESGRLEVVVVGYDRQTVFGQIVSYEIVEIHTH